MRTLVNFPNAIIRELFIECAKVRLNRVMCTILCAYICGNLQYSKSPRRLDNLRKIQFEIICQMYLLCVGLCREKAI